MRTLCSNQQGFNTRQYARYNKRRTSELRSTVSTVWNDASVSESELQPTEKIIWCTTHPTKSSKYVCMSMHLRSLRYLINFLLHHYVAIALALWRGATTRRSIYDYTREQVHSTSNRNAPPQISSLKPFFPRNKYEYCILFTARRGTVSGVTLKTTFPFS